MKLKLLITTLVVLALLLLGCRAHNEELKSYQRGKHSLTWFEYESGGYMSLPGWGVIYKIDCGFIGGESLPLYMLDNGNFANFDSLSVVFLSIDTVRIVPFRDGVPVEYKSCTIDLADVDCKTHIICYY